MMSKMKISEQDFVFKHWKLKETQFVTVYTKTSPNLSCNSTQRAESTHPVTTTLLNHQLSLREAVRRLSCRIMTLLQDLDVLKSESYQAFPKNLDLHAFNMVSSQITKFAIEKIAED
jgi:hypothetical protein